MLILMAIEDMLADLGCTSIATAATIEKALALIEAGPFDVAIVDVNLGGERSYPIAKALKAHGVPFAFSTGTAGTASPRATAMARCSASRIDYPQLTKVSDRLLLVRRLSGPAPARGI